MNNAMEQNKEIYQNIVVSRRLSEHYLYTMFIVRSIWISISTFFEQIIYSV